MSKARELLKLCEDNKNVEVFYPIGKSDERSRCYTQFTADGNASLPMSPAKPKLEAGVYKMISTLSGIAFDKHQFATDELIRFKDGQYEKVLQEVEEFCRVATTFKQFGYTHTRGMILEGYPGTGKSCLIKIIMENIVRNGDIVFFVKDIYSLVEGLKFFREVEPDRKCFVVMEDLDGIINHGSAEHVLLELLDGDLQVDGVLYIATANFLNRLPKRVLLPGRFDKIINIGFPSYEVREAYLEHKLGKYDTKETIGKLASITKGLGFNHLNEMVLRVYVFKEDLIGAVKSLHSILPAGLRPRNDYYVERKLAEVMTMVETQVDGAEVSTDAELIKAAISTRIDKLGFEGVIVQNVEVSPDGDVVVTFKDEGGNEMEVLFGVDYTGSVYAMVLDAYGDDEEIVIVDLDPVSPATFENEFGSMSVDLINLNWLNTTTLDTIMRAGDIVAKISGGKVASVDPDDVEPTGDEFDAFGNKIIKQGDESYALRVNSVKGCVYEKVMSRIVRGGKQLRLPILRAEAKCNLTFKQKESLTKAKKVSKSRYMAIRRRAS